MSEGLIRFAVDGLSIAGTLSLPNGGPAPVVLLLHGFTGTRHEMPVAGTDEGVFSRTARLLAERGLASLRIDFRGNGDSGGAFPDMTFEGQIADARAALAVLRADPRVDGTRIAVLGWSQGGLIAASVAGREPELKAAVLWAAVAVPRQSFGKLLDLAEAGVGPEGLAIPDKPELRLRQAFFHGVRVHKPLAEIARFAGPLLVAHGWQDVAVLPEAAQHYIAAHKGRHELWMADMDHGFNAGTDAQTLDRMVEVTGGFLSRALGQDA
jgi:hypothetical protein